MTEIFLGRQYPITEVLSSFLSFQTWFEITFFQPVWKYSWSSKCIVLDKKSIPIVAWYVLSNESYMNLDIILNVTQYESISQVLPRDKWSFSNMTFSKENQFELCKNTNLGFI